MLTFLKFGMTILDYLNEERASQNERGRWNTLFEMLNDLKAELKRDINAIRRFLTNARLREITASVMDHEEAFRELLALPKEQFLSPLIENTRKSKNAIEQELQNEEITNEDAVRYYALYFTVVPLRVACFEMIDNSQADVGRLVVSELNDLIETKVRIKDTIAAWTDERVSPIEQDTQVEPVRGGSMVTITLSYNIDGKLGGRVDFDGSEPGENRETITVERQDAIENLNEMEWKPFEKILQDAESVIARWKKEFDPSVPKR